MKRILFAAAALAALASCGGHGEAKDAIRKLLNDPESAQFTDLKNGKNKGDVCGMVNAKNRMGGYVGATPFFYEKATETSAIVKAPEDGDFRSLWLGIRAGDYENDMRKLMKQCRAHDQWSDVCTTPHPEPAAAGCAIISGDPKSIYAQLKAAYDR